MNFAELGFLKIYCLENLVLFFCLLAYILIKQNTRRKIVMIDQVKESLCINKIVGNKTFQITVEGDSIIPDSKPDILSGVSTTRKCMHI